MAWKRLEDLMPRQMRQHGLANALSAGRVCQEAERLYPGLFHATALVHGTLCLAIAPEKQVDVRLIEGKLLKELAAFATDHHLPIPTRIRLTISRPSDIV
jgi:hypothetical protein